MENEIVKATSREPVRDIGVITREIKEICSQAKVMALFYAVEIGRRLVEAKKALPYGTWGEWLKTEVEFSQSTANNFMRLFDEYGSAQITIFGASVDSQTFANLPYSKALLLLAVPEEDRETFAEEVGAADLSVKELREAIEARDRAEKIANAQKLLKEDLEKKLKASEDARLEAIEKADEAEHLQGLLNDVEKEAERAKKEAEDLREKLKAAEKDPKIPKKTLDKIKADAEKAARKAEEGKTKAQLDAAAKRASDAEAEAIKAKLAEKQAREALEEAEKKLKTASPAVTEFKVLFDQLQKTARACLEKVALITRDDKETGDKLRQALKALANTIG